MWRLPFVGLLVWLASSWAWGQVAKGPYLQDVRSDRITIACETVQASDCSVSWGPGLINHLDLPAEGLHHEGTITGLTPSSCYSYQLTCGSQTLPQVSFCTAPLSGEPFHFVLFGDTRSDHTAHRQVVDRIREEGVDFVINTGDLVSDGEREEDWDQFFNIEGEMLQELCLFPVVGNHDEDGGQIEIYSRLFALPSESSGREEYYSFRYSNAVFIALDNQTGLVSGQKDWLMDEIDAARSDPDIDHIFVLVHENMYSSKTGRGGDIILRGWRDDLRDKGVNVVFSGHDHYYERGQADNGLHYVISGGGGAPLYDTANATVDLPIEINWQVECLLPCPHTIFYSRSLLHYMRIVINGPYFHACAMDTSGVCFDEFSYGEQPEDGGIDAGDDGGPDAGDDGGVDAGTADLGADDGEPLDPCDLCQDEPYQPLCGEDGVTYDNLCEADCHQVGLAHWGECQDPEPESEPEPAEEPDAGFPEDAGDDAAPADEVDLDCSNCPPDDQPVCGRDLVTYRNECVMLCMQVELAHPGPCKSDGASGCGCGVGGKGPLRLLAGLFLLLAFRRRNV